MNKPVKSPPVPATLAPDLPQKMDAYWRAANYLASDRSICGTIRCSKPRSSSNTSSFHSIRAL